MEGKYKSSQNGLLRILRVCLLKSKWGLLIWVY